MCDFGTYYQLRKKHPQIRISLGLYNIKYFILIFLCTENVYKNAIT